MFVLIQVKEGSFVSDVFSGSPRDVLNWLCGFVHSGDSVLFYVGEPDDDDPESYHDDYDLIIQLEKFRR